MRLSRRQPQSERLDALLRDVGALRMTLDLDLTVAAAAVESDRFDVAIDVLDHDRAELRGFEERVARHLADATTEAAGAQQQAVPPTARTRPRLSTRRKVALSVGQAVLVAAACALVFAGVLPSQNGSPARNAGNVQLEASYVELAHLAHNGGDPARLVAVGSRINGSIEPLIAGASGDPASAQQMLRILRAEQSLLLQYHPAGSAPLLAQARALVARLTALMAAQPVTLPTAAAPVPAPSGDGEATPAAAPSPQQPAVETDPSGSATTGTEPTPTPGDTSTSAPTPSTAPAPGPTPAPTLFPFGVGVSGTGF